MTIDTTKIIMLSDFDSKVEPSWKAFSRQVRNFKSNPVQELHEKGVPAFYEDPKVRDGIIRHLPDGTRQVVTFSNSGTLSVIRSLDA